MTRTELVHFVRPSADLMFESMAAGYRERSIAVVLTGTGSDGEMGVRAVKKMGGTVIAQDQATSEYFGMPGAAIKTGCVDFILPLTEIAPTLIALVMSMSQESRSMPSPRCPTPTSRPSWNTSTGAGGSTSPATSGPA